MSMLKNIKTTPATLRTKLALAAGILLLIAVNFTIYQREQLLKEGRVVLLELTPVDPRSLMQGDYMALRFKVANEAFSGRLRSDGGEDVKQVADGHIVVSVDDNGVGQFKRWAKNEEGLASNEALLHYRIRNDQPKFGTNAFFFQEGHGQDYQTARYGEFRVAKNGDMILTSLRAADYRLLEVQTIATTSLQQNQP
jgi:uncharacterized membrane-anchored protein